MTSYYMIQPQALSNKTNQMFVDPGSIILPSTLISPETSSTFTTTNFITGTYEFQAGNVTLTPVPTFTPSTPPLSPFVNESLDYGAVLNLSVSSKISYFNVTGEYQNFVQPVNIGINPNINITLGATLNGYYIFSNFSSVSTSNMKLSNSGNPKITLAIDGYYEFFSIFNQNAGTYTDTVSSNVNITNATLTVLDKTKTIKIFSLQYSGLMSGSISYTTTKLPGQHPYVNFIAGNMTLEFFIPNQTFFTISSPSVTNASINSTKASAKNTINLISSQSQILSTENLGALISSRGDTVSGDIYTLITNINNLPQ